MPKTKRCQKRVINRPRKCGKASLPKRCAASQQEPQSHRAAAHPTDTPLPLPEQRRKLLTRAEAKRRRRCRKLARVQNKLVKAADNEKKERKLQRKLDKLTEKGITEAVCAPPAADSDCRRRRLQAPFVWDEEDKGSLSTDRLNPTSLGTMPTGSSHLIAVTVSGISKFFTLTIGDGTQLSEIVLDDWDSDSRINDLGFLGLVTGDFFSVDPANPDATVTTELLGYGNHLLFLEEDFLQVRGVGALGPGDYSFMLRQVGSDPITQDLRFVVESSSPAC